MGEAEVLNGLDRTTVVASIGIGTTSTARTWTRLINHPVVGRLELMDNTLQVTADTGLTMAVNTAEPGSSSAVALTLLANWAATVEQTELTSAT